MARRSLHRIALLALMTSACAPDNWRYLPYPDVPPPRDVSDVVDAADVRDASDVTGVTDVTDVSDVADVTDVRDVADVADVTDASPDVPRVVRAGVTTLGPVSAGSLRVTHSLGALSRTCTPDRSICVTGGIAP